VAVGPGRIGQRSTPDLGAIDERFDDGIVNYLLTLRDSVGSIGKYLETLYVTHCPQDIKRFSDEMMARGVPQIEAITSLPPDRLQSVLTTVDHHRRQVILS
jgi:hypothetical protein